VLNLKKITIKKGIKTQTTDLVRNQIIQHVDVITLTMRNKFELLFRHDKDGLPRRFQKTDNIRELFKNARDKALKLLDLFGVFSLPAFDQTTETGEMDTTNTTTADAKDEKKVTKKIRPEDDTINIILSDSVKKQRESEFLRQVEGALTDAESELERRDMQTKIPMWLFGVIAFLGFDEFMYVLRNPFFMFFVILLGAAAYAVHVMNMWGPLQFVVQNSLKVLNQTFNGNTNPASPLAVQTQTSPKEIELTTSPVHKTPSDTGLRQRNK